MTDVPGAAVKFQSFSEPRISQDGARVAFGGSASGIEGLFFWEDGVLTQIVKKTDNYPSTDKPFTHFINLQEAWFAPDGTLYFLAGTSWNPYNEGDRKGLFKYTPANGMEMVADSTSVIDGQEVGAVWEVKIISSGEVLFTAGSNLFAYDGTDLRRVASMRGAGQKFWPIGDHVYVVGSLGVGGVIVNDLKRIDMESGVEELVHRFGEEFPTSFNLLTFDIYGDDVIFATDDGIWTGSVSDFEPGEPFPPFVKFFGSSMEYSPSYRTNFYGWFHSEEEQWPWVYSYSAGRWLYIAGNGQYPLIAWAEELGWIYSTLNVWPWFFDYQQNDWFYWE